MSLGEIRITGGSLRGRRVRVPRGVRPTEARLREALFSIWQSRVVAARFLDLFAGSGAVGLEASSRGAESVLLVEGRTAALRVLRRNCRQLGAAGCRVVACNLPRGLPALTAGQSFDLIFADPPYRFRDYELLIAVCGRVLAAGGELALEHSHRSQLPERSANLGRIDRRSYGDSALSRYREIG